MNLKSLLTFGTTTALAFPTNAQKSAGTPSTAPNIILILMDDMGYGDIGRTGANQYDTPNIDRLAAQGMQFTWFYCPQAVSSASRAGLLTGCYPNRIGISGALMPWAEIGINPEETTINGPWLNFGNHAGTTGGLHEGKGTSWEGGQRVPCIMRWPGVIPAGSLCNKLASSIDILPTIAAITGASLPEKRIDGVNILPLMLGNKEANPRREFLYYYQQNALEAVQIDYWKLVLPHDSRTYRGFNPGSEGWPGQTGTEKITEPQLYDLRRDPGEWYNVAQWYPEKVNELLNLAEKARADLGDELTGAPGANRRNPGTIK